MTAKTMLLALFPDIDPASHAVDELRKIGVADDHVNIISGIPVTEAMLGRPKQTTNVPILAIGGAVAGFLLGIFLAYWTPDSYPLITGNQALVSGPPTIVVLFEMTMLGMLVSAFLGVFLDSRFPSYEPKEYVAEISDGKIGILIECQPDEEDGIKAAMTRLGAESVKQAEAQIL